MPSARRTTRVILAIVACNLLLGGVPAASAVQSPKKCAGLGASRGAPRLAPAALSVLQTYLAPGETGDVIVSGEIAGESTFGVTIVLGPVHVDDRAGDVGRDEPRHLGRKVIVLSGAFVAVLDNLLLGENAVRLHLRRYEEAGVWDRQQQRELQLRGPPAEPSRRGSAAPMNSSPSRITSCTQPM